MITADQLRKMTPDQIARQYARDVIETCSTPVGIERMPGNYSYDFLFGPGSLGYPLRPSKLGESVLRVAERMRNTYIGIQVGWKMESRSATFNRRVTEDAIYEEFKLVFEELVDKMKNAENGK